LITSKESNEIGSKMMKPYRLDDEPVSFEELITAARNEGYEGSEGMFFTSEAAAVLRQNGHQVTDNQLGLTM
jgi:hypothetical protein